MYPTISADALLAGCNALAWFVTGVVMFVSMLLCSRG
jgi:hypothetical protein